MGILRVICLCIIIGHEIASEPIKLTCRDIRKLVDGHNKRRLMLANGTVPRQPPASRMKTIVWDKELAEKALNWAATAGYPSNNPDKTIPSKRFKVGENNFWYTTTAINYIMDMETPLMAWWKEHREFKYGPVLTDLRTGHYTQMAWANTTQLGCGMDKSKKDSYFVHFIVCSYGPAGNMLKQLPYKTGPASKKLECISPNNCGEIYGPDCLD